MSTCISRSGEYSDHEPGDWCPRCGAFNEAAIVAERDHLKGLAAERLEMVVREQKRYVHDTDALFLARKDAERELRDRELHHFEAEKAMTEALAKVDAMRGRMRQGPHYVFEDMDDDLIAIAAILRTAVHTDGSAT